MRSFPVTTKEFTELVFTQYEGNPIVKHTPFSTVIADPSILTLQKRTTVSGICSVILFIT